MAQIQNLSAWSGANTTENPGWQSMQNSSSKCRAKTRTSPEPLSHTCNTACKVICHGHAGLLWIEKACVTSLMHDVYALASKSFDTFTNPKHIPDLNIYLNHPLHTFLNCNLSATQNISFSMEGRSLLPTFPTLGVDNHRQENTRPTQENDLRSNAWNIF